MFWRVKHQEIPDSFLESVQSTKTIEVFSFTIKQGTVKSKKREIGGIFLSLH